MPWDVLIVYLPISYKAVVGNKYVSVVFSSGSSAAKDAGRRIDPSLFTDGW